MVIQKASKHNEIFHVPWLTDGAVFLFILGAVSNWFLITAPVHEFCHVAWGQLFYGFGYFTSWTECRLVHSVDVLLAGPIGEMLVFGFAGYFTIKKARLIAAFLLGNSHMVLFQQYFTGTDMWHALEMQVGDYTAEVIRVYWVAGSFLFYVILWILIIKKMRKSTEHKEDKS